MNKNEGVNLTTTVAEAVAGNYNSVFVGAKLQNTTKLPRVLKVEVAVKMSPELLFFLNTNVPATPALVLLMNDSRVV